MGGKGLIQKSAIMRTNTYLRRNFTWYYLSPQQHKEMLWAVYVYSAIATLPAFGLSSY